MGGQPLGRRLLDQVLGREDRQVHLVADLKRVAAVDEDRRAVGHDDGHAGRAGEAGRPGEAFVVRGDVFAHMGVAARNDDSGEAPAGEFGADGGDPRMRRAGRRRVVIGLEAAGRGKGL